MNDTSSFDRVKAHQFFAADCFNRTWAILDQPVRSPQDEESLILLSHASLWHWTQRADCTDQELSIGYWLISRVFSELRRGDQAAIYAEKCMAVSRSLSPFLLGYAHEAIARAASVQGRTESVHAHLTAARQIAMQIADQGERSMLENDLDTIK
jgi:hypothetical protein